MNSQSTTSPIKDLRGDDALRRLVEGQYKVERAEDGIECVPLRKGRGDIQIRGPSTLGAYIITKSPSQTFKAIPKKCPAAWISQSGEDELIIEHPVDGWREFFEAVGAKRRRRLSGDHAEKLRKSNREFCFTSASESKNSDSESTNGSSPDSDAFSRRFLKKRLPQRGRIGNRACSDDEASNRSPLPGNVSSDEVSGLLLPWEASLGAATILDPVCLRAPEQPMPKLPDSPMASNSVSVEYRGPSS